jgi:glutamine amidotransferase PdxT
MQIKFIKTPDPDSRYDTSEVTFNVSGSTDIYQIIEEFQRFLMAVSFHPELVREAFHQEGESFQEEATRNVI